MFHAIMDRQFPFEAKAEGKASIASLYCMHDTWHVFYPRDAMLARVQAMALRPSVCVCHKSEFY